MASVAPWCSTSGGATTAFIRQNSRCRTAPATLPPADVLGVRMFVAVGYSMGSLVAQLVWQRHRERADALVLCAGAATFARAKVERLGIANFSSQPY